MTSNQSDAEPDRPDYTQDDFSLGDTVVDRERDDPDTAIVVNRPPMAAKEWEAYRVDGEVVTVADDNPEYDPSSKVVVVMFPEDLTEWGIEWDGDRPLPLEEAPQGTAYAFPPARLEPVGTYSPEDGNKDDDETVKETNSSAGTAESTDEYPQESAPTDDMASSEGSSTHTQESNTANKAETNEDTPGQTEPAADDDLAVQQQLEAIAETVRELNVDSVTVDNSKEVVIIEKLGEQHEIDATGSVTTDGSLAQRLQDAIADQIDE